MIKFECNYLPISSESMDRGVEKDKETDIKYVPRIHPSVVLPKELNPDLNEPLNPPTHSGYRITGSRE